MRELAVLFPVAIVSAGCGGGLDDPRAAEIASVMARADASFIRTRGALVAGKYARMAGDPYAFYRGTVPLYRHDFELGAFGLSASRFSLAVPRDGVVPGRSPLVLGDPHLENFGVLRARDGSFGLEANDFDSADRGSYLWDLRRLAIGASLAARLSNADDDAARGAATGAAREIARAAAESYRAAITAFAGGAARPRIVDPGGEPVLEDLFERSAEATAERDELELTVLANGVRKIRRGVLDPEEPAAAHADLPAHAAAALPAAIEAYRRTLLDPPPPAFFTLLDAARVFGSGVASWPRVRVMLLVRGPTGDPGDDVLLELKEIGDSGVAELYPPGVFFDDNLGRVRGVSRRVWAIPDAEPLWGTTRWLGLDCQIKTETEGQKGVRVRRLEGKRGTPEALLGLARALGALLGRMHAAPPGDDTNPAAAIDAAIGRDGEAFADEQADVAEAYADRVMADFALFVAALDELGPRLGTPIDPADLPHPDLAALYGTPPTVSP